MVDHNPPKGFAHSSVGKESGCSEGDPGSVPGLGRSPGEGNGNPLQYSSLENPLGRGACRLQSMGSQESDMTWQLNHQTTTTKVQYLFWGLFPNVLYEEAEFTIKYDSSILQRRPGFDPWVRKIWRREWQSIPVFLPGEFHGQSSPVGYSLWDHKESDMTDQLTLLQPLVYYSPRTQ